MNLFLYLGATLGALIIFPAFTWLISQPLRWWRAPYAKIVIGITLAYFGATLTFAWNEADELRQTMGFWEIVASQANWLLYLPGALLAGGMMLLRQKGKEAERD